jgi:hypothetical protein
MRRRIRIFVLFFLLTLTAILTIKTLDRPKDGPMYVWVSNREWVSEVGSAINQFDATYSRWPTNLSELLTNRQGYSFISSSRLVDRWKRPIFYEAPTRDTPGRVGSFGKDGRTGGADIDADFFIELGKFPR